MNKKVRYYEYVPNMSWTLYALSTLILTASVVVRHLQGTTLSVALGIYLLAVGVVFLIMTGIFLGRNGQGVLPNFCSLSRFYITGFMLAVGLVNENARFYVVHLLTRYTTLFCTLGVTAIVSVALIYVLRGRDKRELLAWDNGWNYMWYTVASIAAASFYMALVPILEPFSAQFARSAVQNTNTLVSAFAGPFAFLAMEGRTIGIFVFYMIPVEALIFIAEIVFNGVKVALRESDREFADPMNISDEIVEVIENEKPPVAKAEA